MKNLTGEKKIKLVNTAEIVGIILMILMIIKKDFFSPNNLVIILLVYNSVQVLKRFFEESKETNKKSNIYHVFTILMAIAFVVFII